MIRSRLNLAARLLALVVLTGNALPAVEISPSDPQAAQKVLAEWYASLEKAQTFATEMDAKIDATAAGQPPRTENATYRLTAARPNRLVVMSSRGPALAVVADDKQVYEYLASKKKYHVKAKPLASFADLGTAEVLNYANYGLGLGLIDAALRATSFETFLISATSPTYVGVETKGTPAHHLQLTYEGTPIDVWFAVEGSKMLRLTVPDMRPMLTKLSDREPVARTRGGAAPAAKPALPPELNVTMTVLFKYWNFDGPVTSATFRATPAPGAEKVYDIFALPPHPLLGKQAPGFVTTTLQGQPLAAGQLAGKVVVLDFWATWCPPCVASLPKITEATAKYRDKGVVFLAVNCGETPADIVPFLTQQNLNAPVVLDSAGTIANLYAVTGIPQTVIIDKKGIVQVVHVGAGANIGDQLSRELDDILAGKDLLAETLKK